MNRQWDEIERRKSLRAGAEALVASLSPKELPIRPTDVLLHELLVHKIELEMQNEELRRTYHELQKKRDHCKTLYEYAPVGLLSIDQEDRIIEINLTGTALLAMDRDELLKQRFSKFVAPEQTDYWHCRRLDVMASTSTVGQSMDLKMLPTDGCLFHAHLDCRRQAFEEMPAILLVALTEFSPSGRIGPA